MIELERRRVMVAQGREASDRVRIAIGGRLE